ncbi:P26 [Alphabaculovirus myunipunctae]|uniref:P26 n=1 Tax=Mythimna unipuncta nucleopolyhedrovirus TaxID=447897 RepID=A0A2K9VSI3_9ABAC|nr:P26 [Mythimna unipuncta nucleopolyhedrovirus]AUV65404.1 P26 [Mythimna unipuncta nucleopolyhedrovirus]
MISAFSFALILMAAAATTTSSLSISSPTMEEIYNVKFSVDHSKRTMRVVSVDNEDVLVKVVPPHGATNGADEYSLAHQFPGVVTQVMFPAVSRDDDLYVMLSNGVLMRTHATRVYANFHVHSNRFIYGQLLSFVVDDFSLAAKIYIGAPIFRNKKLVSVVTCRYDEYDEGVVVFPVSGVRPRRLVSGQYMFDDRVVVQELRENNSVYGRRQLPYASVKNFAIAADNNRNEHRDLPRIVGVFYNERDVTVTLSEGDFEIDRVRFDGPLIVPQEEK